MPPYPPSFVARWHAVRDGGAVAGLLDGREANRGLIWGLGVVMKWLRCRGLMAGLNLKMDAVHTYVQQIELYPS
jgi:hypothetical protein